MLISKKQMFYSAVLFSIALPLLIITYCFSLVNLSNTRQHADLVAHTFQVKENIERLSADVKDAERAQRGYLLVHDPNYLSIYQAALQDKNFTLSTLNTLTADNRVQQKNLNLTAQLIQKRLFLLNHVMETQAKYGNSAAFAIIRTGQGEQLMRAIDFQKRTMLHEENRLLRLRQASLATERGYMWGFSIFFFTLSLVLLVSGYILLRKAAHRIHWLYVEKNQYSEQLEKTSQDLALVATIASHDLKAPLRKLSFFMKQLGKDPGNKLTLESQDFLKRMETTSEKMQGLIEYVLAIAKRQNSSLPKESVNLGLLAQEVTEALDQQIRDTHGKVEISDMCTILGNKYEIALLLQNLIENSLKYRHPQRSPLIRISAHKNQDGGCEIRIADNGIGLAREQQKEIFRMLNQGANSTAASMGLGTVSRIAERNQGTIRVESKPDEGYEFIVNIPASTPV